MESLKILGLSLLALAGVMAGSVSAAQAKWLILEKKASVKKLKLTMSQTKSIVISIPELGVDFLCTGSNGGIEAELTEEDKTLKASALFNLTGCTVPEFPTCEVLAPNKGEIHIAGSGNASIEGEQVFLVLKGSGAGEALASLIQISGEECPLAEVEGPLAGRLHIQVLEPLVDKNLHVGHLLHLILSFAGMGAIVQQPDGVTVQVPVSLSGVAGATWAIHLVGL